MFLNSLNREQESGYVELRNCAAARSLIVLMISTYHFLILMQITSF